MNFQHLSYLLGLIITATIGLLHNSLLSVLVTIMHPSLIGQMLLLATEGPPVRNDFVSPARSSLETAVSPSIATAVPSAPVTIIASKHMARVDVETTPRCQPIRPGSMSYLH